MAKQYLLVDDYDFVIYESEVSKLSLAPGGLIHEEEQGGAEPPAANPKGPLGHPLHGALGGPIGA